MKLYVPARTAIVLAPFEFAAKHPSIKLPAFDKNDPTFAPYMQYVNLQEAKPGPKGESALMAGAPVAPKVQDPLMQGKVDIDDINKEIEALALYGKIEKLEKK